MRERSLRRILHLLFGTLLALNVGLSVVHAATPETAACGTSAARDMGDGCGGCADAAARACGTACATAPALAAAAPVVALAPAPAPVAPFGPQAPLLGGAPSPDLHPPRRLLV